MLHSIRQDDEATPNVKMVILPVCWEPETLHRLSQVLDPEALSHHRAILRASIVEDIRIANLSILQEAKMIGERPMSSDATERKHLDTLLDLLQAFTAILEAIK